MKVETLFINDCSNEPALLKGDAVHIGIMNKFTDAGFYVVNTIPDSELVRAQMRIDGKILLTKDNDRVFCAELTLQEFEAMVYGKVLWISRIIDTSKAAAALFSGM